jgi:predicted phosphodiesterase
MKNGILYALFGDIHHENLSNLEKYLEYLKPDVLFFTGDIDTTQSMIQLKNLEIKYLNKGKQFIKVPGNHDNAI